MSTKDYQAIWRANNPERAKEISRRSSRRVAAARRALLDSIKLERGCVDCGYNLAPEALHFDHRDPATKAFGIGNNRFIALDKLIQEIEKCDVRCANCHAIRTKALGHYGTR